MCTLESGIQCPAIFYKLYVPIQQTNACIDKITYHFLLLVANVLTPITLPRVSRTDSTLMSPLKLKPAISIKVTIWTQ